MRVFLAGTTVSSPKNGVISKLFQRGNKLHSFYHCVEKGFEHGWWKLNMKNKVHLFLDSGAFSAWNQGVEVDLDAYIDFCLEHLDHLSVIANLDVIPGRPFQKLTQADIDHSSRQGWANYQKMLSRGIPKDKLVHIFHQGEDLKWLKRIAGSMPYIGLSPANDKTTSQKIDFLDSCMPYVTDKHGMPTVKFHGFAVTSLRLMLRYPWYCMTDKHQVLTKSGWKFHNELSVGEHILSFDDGISKWEKVLEIPEFDLLNETIVKLSQRTCKAEITKNHIWRVRKENKEWEWVPTDKLNSTHQIPRIGKYSPPQNKTYSDEFVELVGWFWTDGSIKKRKEYKNDSIVIYQSHGKNTFKVERIRDTLNKSGEKFCESATRKGIEITFELYGDISKAILRDFPNKDLSMDFILALTKKQLELFIESSVLADGNKIDLKRGDNHFCIGKMHKKNIEIFRIACLLSGKITSAYTSDDADYIQTSSVKTIYPYDIKKAGNWNEENFTGKVWCVRVPSKAFFTKCDNTIYVTGNSVDSTSWVMTGRLGGVYVPRYRAGKWIYDEDSWKVQVSTRSPSKKDAGKHIDNFPPMVRQAILDYFDDKGYILGKSLFHRVDGARYDLENHERWFGKELADGSRDVERRVEIGLCNEYRLRDELNITYFLDLEKAMPEWPCPYKVKGTKGFDL